MLFVEGCPQDGIRFFLQWQKFTRVETKLNALEFFQSEKNFPWNESTDHWQFVSILESAERRCSDEGKWEGKNGASNIQGWTNYTNCYLPELLALKKKLGNDTEVGKLRRKFWSLITTWPTAASIVTLNAKVIVDNVQPQFHLRFRVLQLKLSGFRWKIDQAENEEIKFPLRKASLQPN